MTTKVHPPFQLCEEVETGSSFYMFPDKFDFTFYNAFCHNLGGLMPLPVSDENYHELMDVVGSLIRPEIHEKCILASGDVEMWLGYTDQNEEDIWSKATDPFDPIPFPGKIFYHCKNIFL